MGHAPDSSRIAITGASGFVGQTLARALVDRGFHVIGIDLSSDGASPQAFEDFLEADLTLSWPDIPVVAGVVHLAGLAAVGPSFENPQRYINVNSSLMTNLCEGLIAQGSRARVLTVSSGAIYDTSANLPITEDTPLVMTSPYVISKVLVESQAQYYQARGLDIIIARPFNHIGPGQRAGFVVPDLYAKINALGPEEVLQVGNLNSRRDFTDVRDIVRAYILLLQHQGLQHRIYNVASGSNKSGWDLLDLICSSLGKPRPSTHTVQMRSLDPSEITGCAKRLHDEVGWSPEVLIQQSIDDFVRLAN